MQDSLQDSCILLICDLVNQNLYKDYLERITTKELNKRAKQNIVANSMIIVNAISKPSSHNIQWAEHV